jgi:hypothetical protein
VTDRGQTLAAAAHQTLSLPLGFLRPIRHLIAQPHRYRGVVCDPPSHYENHHHLKLCEQRR